MSNTTMWGPREDDDYLGNAAKIAMFDMPEQWDPDDDPHPNVKLANKMVDFGKKFINNNPIDGTGFTAIPDTSVLGKGVTQNSTYTAPSLQANNQGLLANVIKPTTEAVPEMVSFSFKAPKIQTPTMTPKQKNNYTTPQPSPFTQALSSVADTDIAAGRATGDLVGAIGGQYLKRGKHDVFEHPNRAEATFTADFLRETGQGIGNTMMKHGSDKAAHDSDTSFNLYFSQNPQEYRALMDKATTDSFEAWRNTDADNDRRNIEKNADNAAKAFKKGKSGLGHTTSKVALALNGALTDAEAKMPTAVEVAHEVRRNRWERENAMGSMMTHQDIRTDTPENLASDTEDYLTQTLIGTHAVNLAKVYAYRGKPFMTSSAVDMFDKSFDVWADNIIEKGDHSYFNALMQTIRDDHPSTNDVLINLIARFMGGNNGDAVLFLWDSMKDADRHEMMKQVKDRQRQKLGITEKPRK